MPSARVPSVRRRCRLDRGGYAGRCRHRPGGGRPREPRNPRGSRNARRPSTDDSGRSENENAHQANVSDGVAVTRLSRRRATGRTVAAFAEEGRSRPGCRGDRRDRQPPFEDSEEGGFDHGRRAAWHECLLPRPPRQPRCALPGHRPELLLMPRTFGRRRVPCQALRWRCSGHPEYQSGLDSWSAGSGSRPYTQGAKTTSRPSGSR